MLHHITSMPESNPNIVTILDLTHVAFAGLNVTLKTRINKSIHQYDQLTESRFMTAMTGGSVDGESFYDCYDWWIRIQ